MCRVIDGKTLGNRIRKSDRLSERVYLKIEGKLYMVRDRAR